VIQNDKILFDRIREDDYSAFNMLFLAYYSRLCAIVNQLIENRTVTEDIVQELFLKIWIERKKICVVDNLCNYLLKAARNSALNYLRKESTRKRWMEEACNAPIDDSTELVNLEEFYSELENCLMELPLRTKQVLILSRFEGFRNKEIAEKFQTSEKTIKNQLWKSIILLRDCLNKKNVSF
jgi:RNA polymerase sigma-70 factor (ECF subfamily)